MARSRRTPHSIYIRPDIPLPELGSLATQLRQRGFKGEELMREIQEHFHLGRLAASTRERFEAAISFASQADGPALAALAWGMGENYKFGSCEKAADQGFP